MRVLLVGLGGFLGSVLRYGVGTGVQRLSRAGAFPFGTLLVNVAGCFAIGFLTYVADERALWSAEARGFVFVGVLGGFTTFSAFGNETMALLRSGRPAEAFANVAAHLILGLGAVALGRALAQATSA
jgi:CrcB protein